MKIRFLALTFLLASMTALNGCGNGGSSDTTPTPTSAASSSSTAAVINTRYTINIPRKTQAAIPDLKAPITASNFAVVIINAAGTITEKIALNQDVITQNTDKTWSFTLAGGLRADRLVVLDFKKANTLKVGDSLYQEGLAYAPTTNTYFNIDVGSTSAYKNLLLLLNTSDSFTTQGIDPLNATTIAATNFLVTNVQNRIDNDFDYDFRSNNLTDALNEIAYQVSNVVKQEIINIKHPTTGNATTMIRDEGGMFSYYAAYSEDINYSAIIGMADTQSYIYRNKKFNADINSESAYSRLSLIDSGWAMIDNKLRVSSYNSDNSVTLQNPTEASYKVQFSAPQVIDLAGRNIKDFLASENSTKALAELVSSNLTFSSGAKGYRLKTAPGSSYSIEVNTDTDAQNNCAASYYSLGSAIADLAGNCNAISIWQGNPMQSELLTDLEKIYSADVTPEKAGFKAFTYFGYVYLQIVNDANKTARAYHKNSGGQLILVSTGTWSKITLPHLQKDATALQFSITDAVINDEAFFTYDAGTLLIKQDGFVRFGRYHDPAIYNNLFYGTSYNAAANNSILTAVTAGKTQASLSQPHTSNTENKSLFSSR